MQVRTDDIVLVEKVLRGDTSAYGILVERYQQYVFTLVLRYVDERERAEELAQDVFMKAYKYLGDFKGNSKFSTWLYTIVHTTCLTELRKKKKEIVLLEEERMVTVTDNNFSEQAFVKHDKKMQQQLIAQALRQLNRDDGEVLNLFYMAEQSIEEIGMITGMTASNIKVRLFRARQKLKAILESRYGNVLMEYSDSFKN